MIRMAGFKKAMSSYYTYAEFFLAKRFAEL